MYYYRQNSPTLLGSGYCDGAWTQDVYMVGIWDEARFGTGWYWDTLRYATNTMKSGPFKYENGNYNNYWDARGHLIDDWHVLSRRGSSTHKLFVPVIDPPSDTKAFRRSGTSVELAWSIPANFEGNTWDDMELFPREFGSIHRS